ncbi:MAG: amino acid ABC transporter permease [Alphaproteobacteria bacterium]|nr:amino acid ABC transporter permease [Alphaproteobacteria bacterium]
MPVANHIPWWRTRRTRDLAFQAALVAGVVALVAVLANNAIETVQRQNIATGFAFLNNTAGFDIVQTLVRYDETSTYARVLLVGVLNTLLVASIGVVLATLIGFVVGIGQLSSNWLVARLCRGYVETLRNLPLLLQIFFWYFAVLRALPSPRESWGLGESAFLNNRGLYLPAPMAEPGFWLVWVAFAVGVVASFLVTVRARRLREKTGHAPSVLPLVLALLVLPPLVISAVLRFPLTFSWPALSGFNFEGGLVVLPELMALVIALATYTASYVAEIVRAGIIGVAKGQMEASQALGLPRGQTLRLVIVPQAMRQIIPPLTSQYLNLTKNSSLAVAIAYPDLVSVFAGTSLSQTGQAIEIIAITMAVYLTISLLTSAFMNWYNARVALTER